MEITITNIILIALFIEAIIQAVKPLWNKEAQRLSIAECISMGMGVLVAVLGKINMLGGIITTDAPVLLYALYALSGIAVGRGPSFVHDLWSKLRTFDHDSVAQASEGTTILSGILQRAIGKVEKPATHAQPPETGDAE